MDTNTFKRVDYFSRPFYHREMTETRWPTGRAILTVLIAPGIASVLSGLMIWVVWHVYLIFNAQVLGNHIDLGPLAHEGFSNIEFVILLTINATLFLPIFYGIPCFAVSYFFWRAGYQSTIISVGSSLIIGFLFAYFFGLFGDDLGNPQVTLQFLIYLVIVFLFHGWILHFVTFREIPAKGDNKDTV